MSNPQGSDSGPGQTSEPLTFPLFFRTEYCMRTAPLLYPRNPVATGLLIVMLLAIWGCAPDTYRARVEATVDAEAFEPTMFSIAPSRQTQVPDAFDFRRMARALAETLTVLGFQEAPDPSQAHILINLGFGLVGEEVPHQGAGFEHLFVLNLEAVDAIAERAGRARKTVWQVTTTAHGHLDHWHKTYKVLLATATPFIGKSAAKDVRVLRDSVTGAYEMQAH